MLAQMGFGADLPVLECLKYQREKRKYVHFQGEIDKERMHGGEGKYDKKRRAIAKLENRISDTSIDGVEFIGEPLKTNNWKGELGKRLAFLLHLSFSL